MWLCWRALALSGGGSGWATWFGVSPSPGPCFYPQQCWPLFVQMSSVRRARLMSSDDSRFRRCCSSFLLSWLVLPLCYCLRYGRESVSEKCVLNAYHHPQGTTWRIFMALASFKWVHTGLFLGKCNNPGENKCRAPELHPWKVRFALICLLGVKSVALCRCSLTDFMGLVWIFSSNHQFCYFVNQTKH